MSLLFLEKKFPCLTADIAVFTVKLEVDLEVKDNLTWSGGGNHKWKMILAEKYFKNFEIESHLPLCDLVEENKQLMQYASGSKLIDVTQVYWEIPWREEPGRLGSTGLQRVRRD